MTLMEEMDARRERAAQDRENSARLAQSYGSVTTTGQGTVHHSKRIEFGLTFIEEPFVSFASIVNVEELAGLLDIDDVDEVPLPICHGYVTEWAQDDRDFYTGAWVSVRVYFPESDEVDIEAQPEIVHHFTFSAIAMKDVPVDATDEVD